MWKKIKSKALVVRVAPSCNRLYLLDQERGLIEVYARDDFSRWRIIHGALVEYSVYERNGVFYGEEYMVCAQPRQWVRTDILFLHHVLELARFFLAYNAQAPEIFELFLVLFRPCGFEDESLLKRAFLCRFFFLTGFYPENHEHFPSHLFCLISNPLDIMVRAQKDLLGCTYVVQWIKGCIAGHPQAERLKTTFF